MSAFGSPFSFDVCSCAGEKPKNHQWIFDEDAGSDIAVYMDYDIIGGLNSNFKYKYLWLCESRAVTPGQNEFVRKNFNFLKNIYRKIFVHDEELLRLDPAFEYAPPAANFTWIKNREIYKKTKIASMVSSGKAFSKGHLKRNSIMATYQNQYPWIDFFGKNNKSLENKIDSLKDYMFSIVVENDNYSNYYTEKIMDCFATGTVPVYLGSPKIGEMFDASGIVFYKESLDLNKLSGDFYLEKSQAIEKNFNLLLQHTIADDVIFQKISYDMKVSV